MGVSVPVENVSPADQPVRRIKETPRVNMQAIRAAQIRTFGVQPSDSHRVCSCPDTQVPNAHPSDDWTILRRPFV